MKRRADGLYQHTITINGKRKVFYGHTQGEINKKILAYRTAEKNGMIFKDVADKWSAEHFPTLAPRTIRGYAPALQRAIEHFGDRYIKQITPKELQTFINDFARRGMAKKTVSTQRLILNLIFDYAVVNNWLDVNFMASVHIPKHLTQTTRRCPTAEELRIVNQHTDTMGGLFAYLILYTGLRRGEALALTPADIKDKYIIVNKSVSYPDNQPLLKGTKTDAGTRYVPLPSFVMAKIKPLLTGKYLFEDTNGGMLTEKHYEKMWKDYQAETGLTITAHQLRHAYASVVLRNAGMDDFDTKEFIGHADITTTRNIYTHITNDRLLTAADLITEIY